MKSLFFLFLQTFVNSNWLLLASGATMAPQLSTLKHLKCEDAAVADRGQTVRMIRRPSVTVGQIGNASFLRPPPIPPTN